MMPTEPHCPSRPCAAKDGRVQIHDVDDTVPMRPEMPFVCQPGAIGVTDGEPAWDAGPIRSAAVPSTVYGLNIVLTRTPSCDPLLKIAPPRSLRRR